MKETGSELARYDKRPVDDAQNADDQNLAHCEVAVLIPCHNEEVAIGKVVNDFRAVMPRASIYVYDNCSTDNTAAVARAAGAVVRREDHQGKGNVVRRMFADVEADAYILVDGDDTYDANSAPFLLQTLMEGRRDMVNGARVTETEMAYRPGHQVGNLIFTHVLSLIFGRGFKDILSGYRALSRRFVKSFPALSYGFEIEIEMTVHALELRMPTAELETPYRARPPGSESKLRTFQDGFRMLGRIALLVKEERPFQFYGFFFVVLAISSLFLAAPIITDFLQTGLVPRLPTAILATGMMLLAFLSLTCGLILDNVTLARREMKRMWYLSARPTLKSGSRAGPKNEQ